MHRSKFKDCFPESFTQAVTPFSGGWIWNAFMFAPVVSSLVVPSDLVTKDVQQNMIDSAGSVLSQDIPADYYHRSWTLLAILMLKGSVESAGNLIADRQVPTSPITSGPTDVPVLLPTTVPQVPTQPVSGPTNGSTSNGIPTPCCSWNGNSCEQPENEWCHSTRERCEGSCNGSYIGATTNPVQPNGSSPTQGPTQPVQPTFIATTGQSCCSDDFKRVRTLRLLVMLSA